MRNLILADMAATLDDCGFLTSTRDDFAAWAATLAPWRIGNALALAAAARAAAIVEPAYEGATWRMTPAEQLGEVAKRLAPHARDYRQHHKAQGCLAFASPLPMTRDAALGEAVPAGEMPELLQRTPCQQAQARDARPARASGPAGKGLPFWIVTATRKGRPWSFQPRAATREAAIERAQAVAVHPLTDIVCEPMFTEPKPTAPVADYYTVERFPHFVCRNGNWDIHVNADGKCASIPNDAGRAAGCRSSHFGDAGYVRATLGIDPLAALPGARPTLGIFWARYALEASKLYAAGTLPRAIGQEGMTHERQGIDLADRYRAHLEAGKAVDMGGPVISRVLAHYGVASRAKRDKLAFIASLGA